MRVFVTTGSAFPFDSLIRYLDQFENVEKFKFVFQIGDGEYIPKHFPHHRYVNNIDEWFHWADLVICHAGAGTIYHLLEEKIPFVAVANFDRDNNHQTDICNFLNSKNLSYAATSLITLENILKGDLNREFHPYLNDSRLILDFIENELNQLGL